MQNTRNYFNDRILIIRKIIYFAKDKLKYEYNFTEMYDHIYIYIYIMYCRYTVITYKDRVYKKMLVNFQQTRSYTKVT